MPYPSLAEAPGYPPARLYSLPLARVVLVLWPPPATQQGKKNARQVSLFSGVKGAGIDRAEAARARLSLALVARGLVCQPLGLVSTPGLSLALDNCVGAIDGVMLYNTYIISHSDSFLSVLRSH